jgi:hypothetical protein
LYIALLRSSRHCGRRGVTIERLVGIALGSMASSRLTTWAGDPKVDAAMLRRALDAVLRADATTPPNSDNLKCEYISFLNSINNPAFQDPASLVGNTTGFWSTGAGRSLSKAEISIKKEPERSRRVYRLLMTNWLAYCDRPTSARPPFAKLTPSQTDPFSTTTGFELYVPEDSAPESLKALSTEKLASWYHTTVYAKLFSPNFAAIDKAMNRDRATFAGLLITLANELHKREKGQYPDKVEELVGPYLKTLPEGYNPPRDQ